MTAIDVVRGVAFVFGLLGFTATLALALLVLVSLFNRRRRPDPLDPDRGAALVALRERYEADTPRSVGICADCLGDVVYVPREGSAACWCGKTTIPPKFMQRLVPTAAELERWPVMGEAER